MRESDARAFASLFRDAHRKCFGSPLTAPLTESESVHFSAQISQSTGYEIGWKSLKNYSHYVLGLPQAKGENPSSATLDTLARYLAAAPAREQGPQWKGELRDHSYWFRYKETFLKADQNGPRDVTRSDRRWVSQRRVAAGLAIIVVLIVVLAVPRHGRGRSATFTDDFDTVTDSALLQRGWWVQSLDSGSWARRATTPGHLTLFTLKGDNWPRAGTTPSIRNLLLRPIRADCFVTDVRLSGFAPNQNWQQAGLLLLEDTALAGKSLRLTIGYNDFAGGFPKTREIIVQAVTSLGRDVANPEEIVHQRLFVVEAGTEALVGQNLAHAALRIEKRDARFRLLYSVGPLANSAFKEAVSTDLNLRVRYVGIFALKSFISEADDMPVYVDGFSFTGGPCDH